MKFGMHTQSTVSNNHSHQFCVILLRIKFAQSARFKYFFPALKHETEFGEKSKNRYPSATNASYRW